MCLEYYRTPGCENQRKKYIYTYIVASREAFSLYPTETKAFERNEERATKERMPRKKEVLRMEAGRKDESRWKERKKERNERKKERRRERTN